MHCQAVVHCLHRYTAALCCSAPLAFVGQTTALRGRDANALGGAKLFISWWRIISVHCGGVQDVWQVVMWCILWFVRHVRSRCTVYCVLCLPCTVVYHYQVYHVGVVCHVYHVHQVGVVCRDPWRKLWYSDFWLRRDLMVTLWRMSLSLPVFLRIEITSFTSVIKISEFTKYLRF